ncbi:MAG: nuclear transport factor 2 family protein [Actinobacteria bacterium]|nr:nuclear transport factor 2 family protein [Actinomycetota bacterium]
MDAADRLAILDLVSRMYRCVDGGDGDGFADLFTERGTIVHPGAEAIPRDAISAYLKGWAEADGDPLPSIHIPTNPIFSGDGDEAVVSTVATNCRLGSPPTLDNLAELELSVSKVAGHWKIDRLEGRPLTSLEAPREDGDDAR